MSQSSLKREWDKCWILMEQKKKQVDRAWVSSDYPFDISHLEDLLRLANYEDDELEVLRPVY